MPPQSPPSGGKIPKGSRVALFIQQRGSERWQCKMGVRGDGGFRWVKPGLRDLLRGERVSAARDSSKKMSTYVWERAGGSTSRWLFFFCACITVVLMKRCAPLYVTVRKNMERNAGHRSRPERTQHTKETKIDTHGCVRRDSIVECMRVGHRFPLQREAPVSFQAETEGTQCHTIFTGKNLTWRTVWSSTY